MAKRHWDWPTTLSRNPSKKGAAVAAFPHAPLSAEWHNLYSDGVVGEYVHSEDTGNDCLDVPDRLGEFRYWFVRILSSAGYYVHIEFLGFGDVDKEKVKQARRWVHYADLKPICHYTDMDGYVLEPPIATNEKIPINDMLARLYSEMIGKLGVSKLADAFVVHKNLIDYKIGDKVEFQDLKCANQMIRGFVTRIVGGRLSLTNADQGHKRMAVKMTDEFWCAANSDVIHPIGWSNATAFPIQPMTSSVERPLSLEQLGVEIWNPQLIKLNACFEMVNPFDYNQIVAAQVIEVLDNGFFLCSIISKLDPEDYKQHANGKNLFHRHITSPWIMPCRTSEEAGVDVVSPDEMKRSLNWDIYLETHKYTALEIPDREEKDHYEYLTKGAWVEAVDHVKPSLICPGYIVKVIPSHLVKIRYLGWNFEFDQWKPIDCPEIYPIGWCSLLGYPLADPGANEVTFENESPDVLPTLDEPEEEALLAVEDSGTEDDETHFTQDIDSDSEAEFVTASSSSEEVQVQPERRSPAKTASVKRRASSLKQRRGSKLLKTDDALRGTSKKKPGAGKSSPKSRTPPLRPARAAKQPLLQDDTTSKSECSDSDAEFKEDYAEAIETTGSTGRRSRKSQKPTKNAGDHILEMSKQPRRKSKVPAKPRPVKIAIPARKSADIKKEASSQLFALGKSKNATAITKKSAVTLNDDDDDNSRSPAKSNPTPVASDHEDSSAPNSDTGGGSGSRGRRSRKPPAFFGNNVAAGQVRFN